MSLYELCASGHTAPLVETDEQQPVSLIEQSVQLQIPVFQNTDPEIRPPLPVYYISDLHLEHHILRRFPNGASDESVLAFVHNIVLELFKDELEKELYDFRSPVILFGGDTSCVFQIAEFFYRDFVATWENLLDERFRKPSETISPLRREYLVGKKKLWDWMEAHPEIRKSLKPLDEFEDQVVPPEIKTLSTHVQDLEEHIEELEAEEHLGISWERNYEESRKHKYIYAVLGNHELWCFDSYEDCNAAYSKLFEHLGIMYLNDQVCWLGPHNTPAKFEKDPKTGKEYLRQLDKEADAELYNAQILRFDNALIVGGLGFAGMNPSFNAERGLIYRAALSRGEELERCKAWNQLVYSAVQSAVDNHCSLVILSHTPPADWTANPESFSNCVFFHGHTHRNIACGGEQNTFIYADNQIGYYSDQYHFKKVFLYKPRNPFANEPDGYRKISNAEYLEFLRFVKESLPGLRSFERLKKPYGGSLYVIKKDGYYAFFLDTPSGRYICNGGQPRKVDPSKPFSWYYDHFSCMVSIYLSALSPLRKVQEQLSAQIKRFGGTGRIHGTIVDIDFYNHIMINTFDGTLTYYNSPDYGIVKTYRDIASLVHAHSPELEGAFLKAGNQPLFPRKAAIASQTENGYTLVDLRNSPYTLSRRINALQKLFDKHILRCWNTDIELDSTLDRSVDRQ